MKIRKQFLLLFISTSHLFVYAQNTEPSMFTKEANEQVVKSLPFDNKQDFEDATRGFIATIDEPSITDETGKEVYGLTVWDFLRQETPASANPSLWRKGQLNRIHGLFEVLPGKIYQIRGFDLANMTFIRSDNGWIVIDVLLSKETALAGYNLLKKHVEDLPVKAVIYTHPHVDHFAGIDAILENAPNKPEAIEIIGPKGFFEDAVSENLMAGVAMGRRATYMYGRSLPKNEKGNIGTGLGQTTAAGTTGLVPPTREISEEGETLRIDGVEIVFMSVPGAEAPSEIMMYFPEMKAMLIEGEKGTAKSTAVRALPSLLPAMETGADAMTVVELPINATEDRVVGSINLEKALQEGVKAFEPGILHAAHQNILYVDEVNLLDDHIVDILLDVAAMGVNTVEREGVSHSHPSRFILVGTMNPEEGDLRPQLLDRFGLSVMVYGEQDPAQRMEVIKRRLAFGDNAESFVASYKESERSLHERLLQAREVLPGIIPSDDVLLQIASISIGVGVDGHRPDITMMHTARAHAAFHSRNQITAEDLKVAARLALKHRLRRLPFEEQGYDEERIDTVVSAVLEG